MLQGRVKSLVCVRVCAWCWCTSHHSKLHFRTRFCSIYKSANYLPQMSTYVPSWERRYSFQPDLDGARYDWKVRAMLPDSTRRSSKHRTSSVTSASPDLQLRRTTKESTTNDVSQGASARPSSGAAEVDPRLVRGQQHEVVDPRYQEAYHRRPRTTSTPPSSHSALQSRKTQLQVSTQLQASAQISQLQASPPTQRGSYAGQGRGRKANVEAALLEAQRLGVSLCRQHQPTIGNPPVKSAPAQNAPVQFVAAQNVLGQNVLGQNMLGQNAPAQNAQMATALQGPSMQRQSDATPQQVVPSLNLPSERLSNERAGEWVGALTTVSETSAPPKSPPMHPESIAQVKFSSLRITEKHPPDDEANDSAPAKKVAVPDTAAPDQACAAPVQMYTAAATMLCDRDELQALLPKGPMRASQSQMHMPLESSIETDRDALTSHRANVEFATPSRFNDATRVSHSYVQQPTQRHSIQYVTEVRQHAPVCQACGSPERIVSDSNRPMDRYPMMATQPYPAVAHNYAALSQNFSQNYRTVEESRARYDLQSHQGLNVTARRASPLCAAYGMTMVQQTRDDGYRSVASGSAFEAIRIRALAAAEEATRVMNDAARLDAQMQRYSHSAM